jgi:type III pantothenate kinase
MLLIDCGNTTIGCAQSGASGPGTVLEYSHQMCARSLKSLLRCRKYRAVLMSSVAPDVSRVIRELCHDAGCKMMECGKEVQIPVVNRYRCPREAGQDRLLNVYAVNRLYKDCDIRLVVDLGTALTFDFITRRGAYNGGLIFPGMRIALDSLLARCAQLPEKVAPGARRTLYSKSTGEGIVNGIDYGYSFLIAGLIEHVKRKDPDMKVLLTGGGGRFLIPSICGFDYYDEHLSLRGLNELARELATGR